MKSRTHLKQTGNPSIKLDPPGSRLGYWRQHLEQSRFARGVSADNADYLARLDLKAYILHCPKQRLCRPPVALQKTQRGTRHARQGIAQTPILSLLCAQPITFPQILNLDNGFHRFSQHPSESVGKRMIAVTRRIEYNLLGCSRANTQAKARTLYTCSQQLLSPTDASGLPAVHRLQITSAKLLSIRLKVNVE